MRGLRKNKPQPTLEQATLDLLTKTAAHLSGAR